MKKVGFIGAFDKSNLIMCIAKILKYLEKNVLVVDTTTLQRMKYVLPVINPTKSYITELEKIDFAVGFQSMTEIERYMEVKEDKMNYDYMLIDIDSKEAIENFGVEENENNYFVTAFDNYSLKRGLEILENLSQPINLAKVLYRFELSKEDEEYLNYLSMEYKVNWKNFSIYLPNLDEDTQAIEENQKVYKIRLKKLSNEFQDGVMYIVQEIIGEKSLSRIRKSIKE